MEHHGQTPEDQISVLHQGASEHVEISQYAIKT